MADAKITELTALTTPAVEDIIPIVDDVPGTPITKKVTVQDLLSVFSDGWTPAGETPTYNAVNKITVASGAATKYAVGDKLKFTQHSVVKYAVVITVADTLLTIATNTDFVVENTGTYAITLFYYSHQASPIGYPQEFSYTPALTNISNGTFSYSKFSLNGKTVRFRMMYALGASGAVSGGIIIGLPINISTDIADVYVSPIQGNVNFRENGVATTVGKILFASVSTCTIRAMAVSGSYISVTPTSSTVPFTWGDVDHFELSGSYEI